MSDPNRVANVTQNKYTLARIGFPEIIHMLGSAGIDGIQMLLIK